MGEVVSDHAARKYRPAIDGLRAIAVSAVWLYHLEESWLPGGFVGVDVFFVISGYLISSIILDDLQRDRFSLVAFYQRRISRIFPHSLLVCFAVLIGSSFVYSPEELGAIGTAAMASAVSLANVKFALQGTYFQFTPDIQPLLHYWSLGVEEQFYLLWPFALVGLHRWSKFRKMLPGVVGLLLVASYAACIVMTRRQPAWAFYLLPFRAWELLAGCLLALIRQQFVSVRFAILSQTAGVILIGVSLILCRGTGFPGWIAILPVLGTALLIGIADCSNSPIERALAHPALVWIGRISFSLYLWHWPVFCLIDFRLYREPWLLLFVLKAVVSVVLSVLAYAWFEQPVRIRLNSRQRTRLAFAVFALGVVALGVSGLWVRRENFSNINVRAAEVSAGGFAQTVPNSQGRVVLLGDSNAGMYGKVVLEMCRELQLDCNIVSVQASNPFPGSRLWKSYLELLDRQRPQVVVYVVNWAPAYGRMEKSLSTAISELLTHAEHVVLVCKPPELPQRGTRRLIRQLGDTQLAEVAEKGALRQRANAALAGMAAPRVQVIVVDDLFVQEGGALTTCDTAGRQLYYDTEHLSYYGALQVKPRIREAIVHSLSDSGEHGRVPIRER